MEIHHTYTIHHTSIFVLLSTLYVPHIEAFLLLIHSFLSTYTRSLPLEHLLPTIFLTSFNTRLSRLALSISIHDSSWTLLHRTIQVLIHFQLLSSPHLMFLFLGKNVSPMQIHFYFLKSSSIFVWFLSFDLFCMDGPIECFHFFGLDVKVVDAYNPPHHNKD